MKISTILENAIPVKLKLAHNLDCIDLYEGYLVVKFQGSDQLWVYGPNVPVEEVAKLLRSPYPDKLFAANIKGKFQCHKVKMP